MTGLPVDVVAKSRGWVRNAYLQHLRANGQTVSSYDATFAVPDPYPESVRRGGGDPILDGFTRALSGAFVGYARDELGFKTDMTYTLLAHDVSSKWEWGDRREPPGVSDDLRELLAFIAVVPAAGGARPHRPRDALWREPLRARPHPRHRRRRIARSSSSIAAATCSISTRIRAAPSPPTRKASIRPGLKPAARKPLTPSRGNRFPPALLSPDAIS